ncbi:helix-turn-helix domain containing protein [Streptomyces sp. NTH33]|uniref:helix-turn-helix domain-containing protein n=1 Tax=Streptomyces sp. NTH33 TaxID=1735453 RepID=UPI000DAA0D7B|nr:helix-turn-helix domain-containing protein [Streptomyces sp. NTH33]PZH16453.1 helix-turn-helix domain containing protein [Streptomyces sp. NTH33]
MAQAHTAPDERPVVGCWVNAGWSAGLDLAGAPDWAAADPVGREPDPDTGGFAQILLARRERASRVTVTGFLVDVYCLGVKNVTGPEVMGSGSLTTYVPTYYSAFDHSPLPIRAEQAQAIVHGAVAYARGLGFEPATDFADAAVHLGTPPGDRLTIGFGRDGKPFYFSGPYDNPRKVVQTLERTCGNGNYHYVAHL